MKFCFIKIELLDSKVVSASSAVFRLVCVCVRICIVYIVQNSFAIKVNGLSCLNKLLSVYLWHWCG